METSFYKKLENYLVPDNLRASVSEYNYFSQSYKPRNSSEQKMIEVANNQVLSMSIAGGCLALALSLSVRRYAGNDYFGLTPRRMIIDCFLLIGGYSVMNRIGVNVALESLRELRKSLLLENDTDYLKHLFFKYRQAKRFYFKQEFIFLELLSKAEFEEWKKNGFINFDEIEEKLKSERKDVD